METFNYKIKKDYKSVYEFLKSSGFSENYIKNLRKKMGYILINKVPSITKSPLKKDDILTLDANPNNKTSIMQCRIPLDIVYEDEYYLLINKPSNLSSMPSKSHYFNNLSGAICYYMNKKNDNFTLRMINRLDKDTSGLILVAKDSISQKEIKNISKKYLAICNGKIDKPIHINSPIKTIKTNGINELKRQININGKEAITKITPISYNEEASLIQLELLNGRTHQIRLHLSSIGHYLIGDTIYGEPSAIINHTALICNELSFYHPFLNKTLNFNTIPPKDFLILIKYFNL